ncbi:MAG: asparagine synthase (glutamine-hydrolyzing), partial [Rhodospirillaceae bacterium]|nr:asparagine synthase (glutamine-hydrolyzing) [Rhodospirillaceae bacterium]
MCGIVGVFDGVAGSQIDPALIRRMADAIAHRGPDGDGFHIAPGIGLGHRRLAIIDLSGGAQPMATADGQTVVVFNGEIYNFREVAAELAAHGCVFRTRSDTEVILEAYRVWGPSCVTRLSGMFAFALWDATSQTLMLARDRIGKKPLYYRIEADRRIAFASEIKALRVDPAFDRRLDPAAIEDFLGLGYVPDPRTIYAAVRKLPPAHTLVWRRGAQPEIRRYWALDLTETPVRSRAEAVDELRARLKAAVAARLISDVPLGAFLSGGVDSSAVVSTMAGLASAPVKTFTIGFGVADHDETGYARLIAEKYGTDHVEAFIDPQSFAASHDMIDRLVGIYDEPFGDNSALPTLRVCAEARKKVTVALSGDGGDEAFAGYRRYLWHVREQQVRSLVPSAIRGPLFSALAAIYPSFDNAPRFLRAGTTLRELAMGSAG